MPSMEDRHDSLGDWGLESRSLSSGNRPSELSRCSSFSINSDESFPSSSFNSGSPYHRPLPDSEDPYGIGIRNTDSLLTSPLWQAVARRNVDGVRNLLSQDAQGSCVEDKEGNNLIHMMAKSTVPDRAQARHNWTETLNATREIIKVLVEHGVKIEAKNESGLTPLLATVSRLIEHTHKNVDETQTPWLEGCAIIALIEAGANMTIIKFGDPYPYLDLWIYNANEDLCHPETYCDVLLCITERVKDLDFSALVHKAIRGGLGYTSERAVHCLLSDLHPKPANVNALNDNGDTPLLAVLQSPCKERKLSFESPLESIISMASALLGAGAKLDFISSSGNTAILSAVSDHRERWRSDDEDVRLMEFLLNFNHSIDAGSEAGHWKLVDITPTIALTRAAFMGWTRTLKFLLDHGMYNRLGELVTFEYTYDQVFFGTLLDIAFFGAQQTRRKYIQLVDPESHPGLYLEDSDNSIEGWAYSKLSEYDVYRDSSDTAKTIGEARYRGHREIVHLLQSYGVKRTRPEGPENEPTYFNAVTMPRTSFFNLDVVSGLTTGLQEGEIPRDEDWKFLYELEILDDEWEKTALAGLVLSYTRLRAWPRPAVLDRWPSLQGKLPFAESQVGKEFFLNAWYPSSPSSISSQVSSDTNALYEDSDDSLEAIDSEISS